MGGSARTTRKTWRARKYCTNTCIYSNSCPAISASLTLPPVKKKDKDYYPCFIKAQRKEIRNYFINLFENGEEGLIKIIMDLHFRLLLKAGNTKASSKDLREAIETSLNMKKNIYGDKNSRIKHEVTIHKPVKEVFNEILGCDKDEE